MRLKERIAIVTGGGNGIGRAISLAFAGEGAIVVVADIDRSGMSRTAGEIESMGGRVDTVAIDLRYEEQIKGLVAHTVDKYGRVDILVNDAAIAGPRVNVADIDLEGWNEAMAINLNAPMLCSREVLNPMIAAGKGAIVNIASEGGRSGFPGRAAYAVAKRGVIALTETLAIEVGGYGIRVNAVSPGRVRGEMADRSIDTIARSTGVTPDEVRAAMIADCSLPRFIEASEIAAAAVFLASDESSAITGHTLVVNCGKHIMH